MSETHPVTILRQIMEKRGITEVRLARNDVYISQLSEEGYLISEYMAAQLERATGEPATFWRGLQREERVARARAEIASLKVNLKNVNLPETVKMPEVIGVDNRLNPDGSPCCAIGHFQSLNLMSMADTIFQVCYEIGNDCDNIFHHNDTLPTNGERVAAYRAAFIEMGYVDGGNGTLVFKGAAS